MDKKVLYLNIMLKKKLFFYFIWHESYSIQYNIDFIFICLNKKDGIFKIWVTRKERNEIRTNSDGKVATFELIYQNIYTIYT